MNQHENSKSDSTENFDISKKLKKINQNGMASLSLNLFNLHLETLPATVFQHRELNDLNCSVNNLSELSSEIGLLQQLRNLDLSNNLLTSLPEEIGQLGFVEVLKLTNNKFKTLPTSVAKLSNLIELDLGANKIKRLPEGITKLRNLERLSLDSKTFVNSVDLLSQLRNLKTLALTEISDSTLVFPHLHKVAQIEFLSLIVGKSNSLPSGLNSLGNLTSLSIISTELREFPDEIFELSKLGLLILMAPIEEIPDRLNRLNLSALILSGGTFTELPSSIGQISSLDLLMLSRLQLTSLPDSIGDLTNLTQLMISGTHIRRLPLSLANLPDVSINVRDNPLEFPPPEIVSQGSDAILAFLREQREAATRQWVSKLMVVGEGGTGKTSLLRSLHNQEFILDQPTTHGIELRTIELPHPTERDVNMSLTSWDFGGQEIYHATHQFCMTNRSLYLVVWSARLGYEQGKLYYWLDAIQARAPQSPILLIATWTDEREADLPLADLKRKYPQIVGSYRVSNKNGDGIAELREAICHAASQLPLMGELWPATWLKATTAIRNQELRYMPPGQFFAILSDFGVKETDQKILARWLHELGEILFFQDDEELNDTVILRPDWVTQYISRVLESSEVIKSYGVFSREHMYSLWSDLDRLMQDHFLRLMERFDLSYRTLENKEISIVVERLSLDEPTFHSVWDSKGSQPDTIEVSMRYYLNTIPAGVPTWFIARSHRFTTHTHWRLGALFAYEVDRKHLALVRAFPHERRIDLIVRGPSPQNFFSLLSDGLEVTLRRFDGLEIQRKVPCPGHNGQTCTHEFDYEDLRKRMKTKPFIECTRTMEDVPVIRLLFGLHWSANAEVIKLLTDMEEADEDRHEQLVTKIENFYTLTQREFLKVYKRQQAQIELQVPNLFVLRPVNFTGWRRRVKNIERSLAGKSLELHLLCQEPGDWHFTDDSGCYELREPATWIKQSAPFLRHLVAALKTSFPLLAPFLSLTTPELLDEQFKLHIDFMEKLVSSIPQVDQHPEVELLESVGEALDAKQVEGASLRAVRALLEHLDPHQTWGGLRPVLTPEGHYLWLCDKHAKSYLR